ncbi:MAG: helix-turn-helix transcriptional regulator [Nitrospirae bacterium]|nr:helix-turn-helix transcriptional regulator [Nitrospirota bacterium]
MHEKTLILNRFGKQLQRYRKQLLLSREDLGIKTGLTVKDIEDLERGIGDPSLSIIYLLAEAIKIEPAELLLVHSGYDEEYFAYRFHLMQLVNKMTKKELKKVIASLN